MGVAELDALVVLDTAGGEFRDGEVLPFSKADEFMEHFVYGKEAGGQVPNPSFTVGHLPSETIKEAAQFISGMSGSTATVHVSGRSLKHTDERRHDALKKIFDKLPKIIAGGGEVLLNPNRPNSAFLVYQEGSNYLLILELAKDGSGTSLVNLMTTNKRSLRTNREKTEAWLAARSQSQHPKLSLDGTHAVSEFSDVQPSKAIITEYGDIEDVFEEYNHGELPVSDTTTALSLFDFLPSAALDGAPLSAETDPPRVALNRTVGDEVGPVCDSTINLFNFAALDGVDDPLAALRLTAELGKLIKEYGELNHPDLRMTEATQALALLRIAARAREVMAELGGTSVQVEVAIEPDNIPSAEMKASVLELAKWGSLAVPAEGGAYLAAKHKKNNRGIFVVDGKFDRATFKVIIAEAKSAGLATDKFYVYGDSGVYSGGGIEFTRLDELGRVAGWRTADPVEVVDEPVPEGVSESPDDEAPTDELSDDPNSPNYRFRDTGYIADSRKEKAQDIIYNARKTGERVRAQTIDWDAIEQNPRQAADLVTKANLFGKPDWSALQETGMEPGAGFLIAKIYASIGTAPATDGPLGRKDYAFGLETIRDRLENRTTVDEVRDVIDEIRAELFGTQLNAEEADQVQLIRAEYGELRDQRSALDGSSNDVYAQAQQARSDIWPVEKDIDNRKRRGWAVDAAKEKLLADTKARSEALWAQFALIREDVNPKIEALRKRMNELAQQERDLTAAAKARNLMESSATRAWLTFGERFVKLVNYRSFRNGSDSFAGHLTNAKAGRITDWSWADKDRPARVKEATKQEINFQMRVADKYDRVGGADISVNSTQALKEMLGFRDVQSGNWVLKDPNSAKFHVEQTAAAMSDLADITGIDMKLLGFGGRLGMAFGARGTGGKNAARAHYEPVLRVINLTKQGGGGALGHEWSHSLDNILHELVNEKASAKKDDFITVDPDLLPEGELRDAVKGLRAAMLTGSRRAPETIKFTQKDIDLAKYNIDSPHNRITKAIKDAGNATDGVLAIDAFYPPDVRKELVKKRNQWRKLAAAYYAAPGETLATLPVGRGVSEFVAEATKLDNGTMHSYWSKTEELFARACQSWIEDRLADKGRKNDYLSAMADNKHYDDGPYGPLKPFPEGDERTRINAAIDKIFEAIRNAQVFEKANVNQKLLDSIFSHVAWDGPRQVVGVDDGFIAEFLTPDYSVAYLNRETGMREWAQFAERDGLGFIDIFDDDDRQLSTVAMRRDDVPEWVRGLCDPRIVNPFRAEDGDA